MTTVAGRVVRATTVEEAVAAHQQPGDWCYLAGGTDVMVGVGRRWRIPAGLVTVGGIAGLTGVRADGSEITIGALTSMADLQRSPAVPDLLRQASRTVATPQVRSSATVGGNLALRRADLALPPCLIAAGGRVRLVGPAGERTVAAADLARSGCHDHEFVVDVTLTVTESSGVYLRVGPRNGPCYATVCLALVIDWRARTVGLGLGGVADTAVAADEACAFAAESIDWSAPTLDPETVEGFARRVVATSAPRTDVTATAGYRRHALAVMARRALDRTYREGHRGTE